MGGNRGDDRTSPTAPTAGAGLRAGAGKHHQRSRHAPDEHDDASAGLGSVCPPVGGRYRTAGALDAFDGAEAAGDWTLELDDVVAGDTGMLLNWSIRLETERQ